MSHQSSQTRTIEDRAEQEHFTQYLKEASETVRSWPAWKQTILGWTIVTGPDSPAPARASELPDSGTGFMYHRA